MATGAIIAGGTLAAAGGAAAYGASRIKGQKPNKQQFGGSPEALQGYRDQYQGGVASGQDQTSRGLTALGQGVDSAQAVAQRGQQVGARGDALMRRGTGQYQQGQAVQNQALRYIGDAAAGNAPSAAQEMLKANADANARQQMAMASTARGGNQAAAMRAAADAGTMGSAQAGQQAAILRAQEMAQARGELAGLGSTIYGQGNQANALGLQAIGQGMAGQQFGANAQMGAGQFAANLGAGREGTYLSQLGQMEGAQLAANVEMEKARAAAQQDKRNAWMNFAGKLVGAGGRVTAAGMGG